MRRSGALVVALQLVAIAVPAQAGTDELRSLQWGLDRIGVDAAWTKTQGAGVVVAVIDTGVDLKHPDLEGRLLPGIDLVDQDDDPTDEHGHGTLVAGIIAANLENDIGGAGVAPQASILPVRALDRDGVGGPEVVADAIDWSVEHGADVINLSLSVVPGDSVFETIFTSSQVEAAVNEAAEAGVLVLIASGNSSSGGQSKTAFDASRAGVLVVGASTKGDTRAAYSDYGTGLDLVAPGGGTANDASASGCPQGKAIISTWWTKGKGSGYGATCGTSMATAFASGVGALLIARGLSSKAAAKRMLATAKDIEASGADSETGAGRVDAAAALGVGVKRPTATPTASIAQNAEPPAGLETPAVKPGSGKTPAKKPSKKPSKQPRSDGAQEVLAIEPPGQVPLADRSSVPAVLAGMLILISMSGITRTLLARRAD